MAARLVLGDPGFETAFTDLLERRRARATAVDGTVAAIVADVRARGDQAVREYTARFDDLDVEPAELRISARDREAAREQCDGRALEALEFAAARIEAFHRRHIPEDQWYEDDDGVGLGVRWTAICSVGIYVPGGGASYPSSVLMNGVPARVAGVERVVMAVPAPGGVLSPLVIAAAQIAGIDEIYRIGGAQAIAALAYGTETIPRVDKIVGPGNAYVTAAKRRVFGDVGIDTIAGPSEVLIISDNRSDPDWIAADLLAQAEHDEDAQAILITDDGDFADRVSDRIEAQLKTLERAAIARQSWDRHGAVIIVDELDLAAGLADRVAPEHLEIATAAPDQLAARVGNAGAIFLGRLTPEAIGDYVAGPSHVLPTTGAARFASGLTVLDFLKRTSLVRCDRKGLARLGPSAIALAEAEGLAGHAKSVTLRLGEPPGD